MKKALLFLFIACIFWACYRKKEELKQEQVPQDCAIALYEAKSAKKPYPLSHTCQEGLDLESAYQLQKEFVMRCLIRDEQSGFKAGLTSKVSQEKFGATAPIRGVLFASGAFTSGDTIQKSNYVRLMLELEIGYYLKEELRDTVSLEELPQLIASIIPVIELPNIAFENPKELKPADIIAANAASAAYVRGASIEANSIDPNAVKISMSYNGAVLNEGEATDAMGSQWEALRWLVNQTLLDKGSIKPNDLLITGSLGKVLPLEKGYYQIDYGNLGSVEFWAE